MTDRHTGQSINSTYFAAMTSLTMDRIWFQLVNAEGKELGGPSSIRLTAEIQDVDDLRDAVRGKLEPLLQGVPLNRLRVYANKAALDTDIAANKTLTGIDPGTEVQTLAKTTSADPLLIVVPERVQPTTIQPPQTEPYPRCETPFFNTICEAAESDGWISFETDIPSTSLNRLYIRECYQTIASTLIEPGIKKAIVTGTPGIGKSLFLIYLLWKLVKEGKRVLVIYHPHTIYYDGRGGVFDCLESDLPPTTYFSFWNTDLWILFDAKMKEEHDLGAFPFPYCNCIVFTSPRRAMVNDFKKPPVPRKFYMPTWTETELQVIAPFFPNANEWRDRFEILGGIPRYVLEDTEQDPTKMLEAACTDCEMEDIIMRIGLNTTTTEKSKVIHRLIHITSTPPYTDPYPGNDFASPTALNIVARMKREPARRMWAQGRLQDASRAHPHIAALYKCIFEP